MGTDIKTWQIIDGKLVAAHTVLKSEERTEPYDLEPWLASQPEIIASDLLIVDSRTASANAIRSDRSPWYRQLW
jgi:hypothetical protein